uniref:Uncharacterized protein n=1 Tax=Glycine max TaxID=3847 RepID=C6TMD8_SOYBN|nr:unknown [Glycine max]
MQTRRILGVFGRPHLRFPKKTLTILRGNCLKLLHTNGSRVT